MHITGIIPSGIQTVLMGYLPEAVGLRFSYQWMSRQELLLCGIIQPRLLMYTPNPVNLK